MTWTAWPASKSNGPMVGGARSTTRKHSAGRGKGCTVASNLGFIDVIDHSEIGFYIGCPSCILDQHHLLFFLGGGSVILSSCIDISWWIFVEHHHHHLVNLVICGQLSPLMIYCGRCWHYIHKKSTSTLNFQPQFKFLLYKCLRVKHWFFSFGDIFFLKKLGPAMEPCARSPPKSPNRKTNMSRPDGQSMSRTK